MSKLYKFMALPKRTQWLYANAAFWLMAVKVGLYLLPFNRLRGWMAHPGQLYEKPTTFEEMRATLLAIGRISQFLAPLRINCLPQALVGHRLLRQQGFDVQLKIGVARNPGDRLAAHAWLEYQGRVILGDLRNLSEYIAFPSLE